MVLRRDARGVLAVGQPAHAWLCGQLARAWGNERFGEVVPLEAVALGAEQHDVGMAEWDLRPTRDPRTGLPYSFAQLPLTDGVALWRAGPRRLITQSRYAALLAARHGRRLYERRDLAALEAGEAALVETFLAESHALEAVLADGLGADPALLARNSQLVWTWDTLSLAVLLDWSPLTLREVPAAADSLAVESLDVEVRADGEAVRLDPWPFASDRVRVHCEGRRLTGGCASDPELAEALAVAPWETFAVTLTPGRASVSSSSPEPAAHD
ncbi:MAG: DUF3891 family protein [Solirubrobacterales bacterium]|nr:DUF3891 family protein [Solirubrobacterales bacterium]